MSVRYVPVSWTRAKWIYDAVLLVGSAAYLSAFFAFGQHASPTPPDEQTLAIRAYGTCAFVLISIVLCIGPLARLDRRFLPLLYNRRHFGMVVFAMASAHLVAVADWYLAYSTLSPWVALLASEGGSGHWRGLPFIPFGVAAFLILAVLATTSHDFWLGFLGPPLWKSIHMLIYVAYALIVAHVVFGALQDARNGALALVAVVASLGVTGLHVAAARRSAHEDLAFARPSPAPSWIDVGPADCVPEGGGIVVRPPGGEAVAIFNDGGAVSAVSHACAHQNGPLGEGRILDGCVVCPWHGFQYRLVDGCAPAPFTEKIATYRLSVGNGRLLLDPQANPPGTRVEPVRVATRP